MKELTKIIELLKPKFYNRITYVLVISGTTLLAKPIWLDLLNLLIQVINSSFEGLQLQIIGKWDWLIGLIVIVIALYWNTRNRLIDLKSQGISEPAYKKVMNHKCDTFIEVCQKLRPILKDNEYIFQSVGPNSSARSTGELRTDLTLWNKYRSQSIIPNNRAIKEIINTNKDLFGEQELEQGRKMIIHIDAFEEHVKNPEFDYTDFQFPVEFAQLVEITCFESAKQSKILIKKRDWLKKRLSKMEIDIWYMFGSILFIPEKAKDFDIVLYGKTEISDSTKAKINKLKLDFNLKFSTRLHVTMFAKEETQQFQDFINYNNYKLKGNG